MNTPTNTASDVDLTHISPRDKAEILAQALPYIRKFHGKTLVIKYGGNACAKISALSREEMWVRSTSEAVLVGVFMAMAGCVVGVG